MGHGVAIQKMCVKGWARVGGVGGRLNFGFFMTVVYFQCCCLSKNQTHKIVCKLLMKLAKYSMLENSLFELQKFPVEDNVEFNL